MPHQCLQCGKVFPSGSPEILKGCNECGGKKFFYTEQPVSDEERKRLTEQANKDIKVLIHEILSQSSTEPITTYDSEGKEAKPGTGLSTTGSGWVKVTPSTPDKSATIEPSWPSGAPKETVKHPTVKDLLKELRSKPEIEIELPEGKQEPGVKEKLPIVKTRPKKKGKVKLKRRVKGGLKKRDIGPEVIRVIEPGVYEIYLSKLLKHSPIIINRDGTYLVHLPSVFNSMSKENE